MAETIGVVRAAVPFKMVPKKQNDDYQVVRLRCVFVLVQEVNVNARTTCSIFAEKRVWNLYSV